MAKLNIFNLNIEQLYEEVYRDVSKRYLIYASDELIIQITHWDTGYIKWGIAT